MKDLLILLMLLNAKTTKVCPLLYQTDPEQCLNKDREYFSDVSNQCCRKCRPGERLKIHCNETADTECEPCSEGQYMENWNYAKNCISCPKCKTTKGLQFARNCSPSVRSTCVCQPGMYCILGFDDPYCEECLKQTVCKAGYGVAVPGRANSRVKCAKCRHGTFSSIASYTESCLPHTDCSGRAVLREGNATSDTVCEPLSTTLPPPVPSVTPAGTVYNAPSPVTSTASVNSSFTLSINSTILAATLFSATKKQPATFDMKLVAAVTCVAGVILILILVVSLVLCKRVRRRDANQLCPKTDANGNCESIHKINPDCLRDTQLTLFTVTSSEQQCLLETANACSNPRNNTENLIRGEGCSSQGCESIGPLQSTIALHDPHTALSDPMPLLSYNEPVSPQPIGPPQSSSQPTSPHLISPVASNPHVNVNITFHIGNGTCGRPPVLSTDNSLPLAEEEQCFSVPQQEDGKQSVVAVQESES